MQRRFTPSTLLALFALVVGLSAILVGSPAVAPTASAAPAPSTASTASTDSGEAANKALVRDYYATVLNGEDFAALEHFVASGSERTSIEASETRRRGLVPDLTYVIEEMVAEGDTVVVRMRQTGTHTGSIDTVPATGEAVDVPAVAIYEVDAGKLRERFFLDDKLKLVETVGYRIEKPGA